jgi:hypothetical protein
MEKSFITLAHGGKLKYRYNLLRYFNQENVIIAFNYMDILYPRDLGKAW